MPETDYFNFFRPTYKLHLEADKKKNMNSPQYLENLKNYVLENIRHLPTSPSVQMQELPPRDLIQMARNERRQEPIVSRKFMRRITPTLDEDQGDEDDD